MPRKYRPWSRAEYDRLEQLINAGWRYADIADDMGRGVLSIQGTAQRIGLMSDERRSWRKRQDWPEIDRMIIDCIECSKMSVPQVSRHLGALGKPTAQTLIYRRLETMPQAVRRQAKENGNRRRSAASHRRALRNKLAA